MAKDPAFLFYSSDFLSGVSDLTFEERGHYITLICLQHQKGHLSKKIIDLNTPNLSKDVLNKFTKDENGLYYNKRTEEEITKRKEHSEKQRLRAKEGWKKRKATANATALPLEDENENEDIIINTSLNKKERILKNQQWIEQICMNKRQELSFVNDYLTIFLDDLELKQDLQKEDKEIQSHFINWFNLNLEKLKKNDNGSTKSRRQRFIDSVKN